MKKLRALSPIVAVLLLIVVAAIAGVLVYNWMTGYAGEKLSTTSPSKILSIEAATAFADTDEVIIYIRNDGTKIASISRVYYLKADGSIVMFYRSGDVLTDGTNIIFNATAQQESLDIEPGDVNKITLKLGNAGIDLQPGLVYRFRIVTYDGSQVEVTVKAV